MKTPKRILIVDDEPEHVRFLEGHLREAGHDVETAQDGFEALAKVRLDIDLVLLDLKMPGMDGFEVLRRIREDADLAHLPVLMVTAREGRPDRLRAVEAGANDFIPKPVDLDELRIRAASLLKLKDALDAARRHRDDLERRVRERTETLRQALKEMAEAQRMTYAASLETIRRLAIVAEYKDKETAAHINRVREYALLVAESLNLPPGEVELIGHAAPMHDVGKIIVPEAVLLKPGQLTAAEWEVMREHTVAGGRILEGSASKVLQMGEAIALSHHERWDGNGYPHGLAEGDIPIAGRICAVADVFDALTSERPYKRAFPIQEAFDVLMDGRGGHFDPRILEVFFRKKDQIRKIQARHLGGPKSPIVRT